MAGGKETRRRRRGRKERPGRWMVAVAVVAVAVLGLLVASTATAAAAAKRRKQSSGGPLLSERFFQRWGSFKELEGFMAALVKKYKSTKMIKSTSIGRSAEKRSLHVLSIGTSTPRHTLMMMATMHGREWISPYATLYTAWQLLKGYAEGDAKTVELLESTQVLVLPVLNPDGYEFTRIPASKSETARQWRKNRRSLCPSCQRGVHGVDLNRNWGVADKSWGFGNTKATTEVYQGKRPFSEPEIQAVRAFLLKKNRAATITAFFDVHCCSGAILPPFYYQGEPEELQKKHLDNCKQIAKSMRAVNGVRYKWRKRESEFSASNTGVGVDWIYGEAHVENVFIVETRGNNTKLLKEIFEVPEDQIIPIARELEAGFWKMAELFVLPDGSNDSKVASAAGMTAGENALEESQAQAQASVGDDSDDLPVETQSEAPAEERQDDAALEEMSLEDLLSNLDQSLHPGKKKVPAARPKSPPTTQPVPLVTDPPTNPPSKEDVGMDAAEDWLLMDDENASSKVSSDEGHDNLPQIDRASESSDNFGFGVMDSNAQAGEEGQGDEEEKREEDDVDDEDEDDEASEAADPLIHAVRSPAEIDEDDEEHVGSGDHDEDDDDDDDDSDDELGDDEDKDEGNGIKHGKDGRLGGLDVLAYEDVQDDDKLEAFAKSLLGEDDDNENGNFGASETSATDLEDRDVGDEEKELEERRLRREKYRKILREVDPSKLAHSRHSSVSASLDQLASPVGFAGLVFGFGVVGSMAILVSKRRKGQKGD